MADIEFLEAILGAAAAALLGRAALPRGRGGPPAAIAEDLVTGLAIVVPSAFLWGIAGLPWTPVWLWALALALAALARVASGSKTLGTDAATTPPGSRGLLAAAGSAAALAFLTAAWKWIRAPLWSWDHYAIWGLKGRRLVPDGHLDLSFLALRAFDSSNPDYPIGLPLAWRFLFPSGLSASGVKLAHGLFALALAAAVAGAARRLGASRGVAALAVAWVCASPLIWDTEAVGLAELPLAGVAAVGVLLALRAQADARFPTWPAGAALGFLAWIKTEGLVLGALLALGAGLLAAAPARAERWRRRAGLWGAWLAWALAAVMVRQAVLGRGVGFLEGDWTGRLGARWSHAGTLVRVLLGALAGPEWLGVWWVFAAAAVGALWLRAAPARVLAAAVLAQLVFYAFVYLATYLDPLQHVGASFHRLAAALVPLAALAAVSALAAARTFLFPPARR